MLEWIKAHAQWIAGGAVAIIVGWYLLSRPKSSTNAPTSVSFPTQATGAADTTPTGLPAAPALPTLPSVSLGDITKWQAAWTATPGNTATSFQDWLAAAPSAITSTLSTYQMQQLWNEILASEQSPTSPWHNNASVVQLLNSYLQNPQLLLNVAPASLLPPPAPRLPSPTDSGIVKGGPTLVKPLALTIDPRNVVGR